MHHEWLADEVLRWSEEQWLAMPLWLRQALVGEVTMPRLRETGTGTIRGTNLLSRRRVARFNYETFIDETLRGTHEGDKRALNLLRRHLSDDQWECLGQHGFFYVTGRMRRYGRWQNHLFQIHHHCLVYEVEPTGRRHYCMVALEPGLPDWDWMLAVSLLIRGNLRLFFATAKKRGFNPASCQQM